MSENFTFTLHATDGKARLGEISMPRGTVRTPAFMPVGTGGTVKAMYPEQVEHVYGAVQRDVGAFRLEVLGAVLRFPHLDRRVGVPARVGDASLEAPALCVAETPPVIAPPT